MKASAVKIKIKHRTMVMTLVFALLVISCYVLSKYKIRIIRHVRVPRQSYGGVRRVDEGGGHRNNNTRAASPHRERLHVKLQAVLARQRRESTGRRLHEYTIQTR